MDDERLHSPTDGVRLDFADLRSGVRLRVASAGQRRGARATLLFLHGWPEVWFSWRKQLSFFAGKGFYCLAPDLRGFGASECPHSAAAYSCHHVASDMIALLQHHGVRKCALIGHDWGAILGWQFALLHPEYFPVVANLSVPLSLRTQSMPDLVTLLERVFGKQGAPEQQFYYILYHNELFPGTEDHGPAEAEYDANPHELLRTMWTDTSVPQDPLPTPAASQLRKDGGFLAHHGKRPRHLPAWLSEDDLSYVVEQYKLSGFRGGVNLYRNFKANHETTAMLVGRKVKQPVFFLTGEDDMVRGMSKFFSSSSSSTAKNAENAASSSDPQKLGLLRVCTDLRAFHVLRRSSHKTAGHWIQQEQADEVNALLLNFLEDTQEVMDRAPGGGCVGAKL
jgi:pimeloyl-ACP methyl ester carboxylesterase